MCTVEVATFKATLGEVEQTVLDKPDSITAGYSYSILQYFKIL